MFISKNAKMQDLWIKDTRLLKSTISTFMSETNKHTDFYLNPEDIYRIYCPDMLYPITGSRTFTFRSAGKDQFKMSILE